MANRVNWLAAGILYTCAVMMVPVTVEAGTITVRADGTGDYPTIQAAINAANPGDEVVLEPGTYNGDGNRELNFNGKAITVRSLEPENNTCMRETIIDAEGQGVIVRFVNDEGPESVFAGFTLLAGSTSVPVHGIAGFFEFSDSAKPTTRRLRVGGDVPPLAALAEPQIPRTEIVSSGLPYGGRLWDGNNPFHQPAETTDYYGSGDVDNDGNLTPTDALLAQEIADGLRASCVRADVDGDEDVDNDDVSLISSAVSGGVLAGWWNSLASRTQRDSWVTKFLAIDQTDAHPYMYYFQCLSFAVQTHINGAFHRGDLSVTLYDGGPTVFNIPLYYVSISATGFGHGINGILVGDDPLNFDDWRFFEPQNDYDAHPGEWNMPYGSTIKLCVPSKIWVGGFNDSGDKVKFYVDEAGWTLQDYSEDLILTRPTPIPQLADNRPDLWNPRIVPVEPNIMILFERSREDMSRTVDIHLADLPFVDPPQGLPLVMSAQYSRLLDIYQGPDGYIHLLWAGKRDYYPGLFHGKLNRFTRELTNVTRITNGIRMVRMGRVIVTTGGEVHVFWLEHKTNTSHPYETGIYWTRWTGSAWQGEVNLAPPTYPYLYSLPDWEKREFLRYYFDVDISGNGDFILVWVDPIQYTEDTVIRQRRYDGTWGSVTDIETADARGVELLTDSTGTLHLAYWLGTPGSWGEGRGNLIHRTSDDDGASWSAAETVDASGNAACSRMAAGAGDVVYLVWERKVGSQVVPICNMYENGTWGTAQQLTVRPGAEAWYPTVDVLPDNRLMVAWSSRSADLVTIEVQTVKPVFDGLDEDNDVDLADFAIFALAWRSSPGDDNWNLICDISYPRDDIINKLDLGIFSDNWLKGVTLSKLYDFSLDTDPGWTTEGQWAFGQPTGGGGTYGNPDPASGNTGTNVYGVNLNGDYSTAGGGPYYLTAGPFDFSLTENVKLRFARWLNTDYPPYVQSKIEVSNDGSLWNTVWEHVGSSEIVDNDWQIMEYDISSTADGQETVYIRWSYEVTSGAWAYSGWNIDDIQVGQLP